MNIDTERDTDRQDKPLTRADVEYLLQKAGSADKLHLHGENLKGADLSDFKLRGADLSYANLRGADLRGADLREAILATTDLREANLSGANLSSAKMLLTNLGAANLSGVNLSGAVLRQVNLSEADLSGAILNEANLYKVNLHGINLNGAILHGTMLLETDLNGVDLSGALLSDNDKEQLRGRGAIGLGEPTQVTSTLRISITEEPLTLSNLTTILSAFTELATKCWLIANDRFFDLVEYTQTHDVRFTEEAQIIVTQVSYNSPFGMNVNLPNLDLKNFAEAIKEGYDALAQRKQRQRKIELDNEAQAIQNRKAEANAYQDFLAREQERNIALQKAIQENAMGLLEQEKKQFEIEKQQAFLKIEYEKWIIDLARQRVAWQKENLELEYMGKNYAIEAANKIIDRLSPGIDQAARTLVIPTLLSNLLQIQNGKGVEFILPAPDLKEEREEESLKPTSEEPPMSEDRQERQEEEYTIELPISEIDDRQEREW